MTFGHIVMLSMWRSTSFSTSRNSFGGHFGSSDDNNAANLAEDAGSKARAFAMGGPSF
eukprot:JP442871.1.p2 GENE.JP442871.1~~JP442871.1.p2  ORF type:complete len:66 (+),score=14.97 JP442871.1:27-200(+)